MRCTEVFKTMVKFLLFRSNFLDLLHLILHGEDRDLRVNKFVFKLVIIAVKSEYGVDLREEIRNHRGVEVKRMLVNFLIDHTGWSQSHVYRFLIECGAEEKGATRRTISYYKYSHNQNLISENIPEQIRYSREYSLLCDRIKSFL